MSDYFVPCSHLICRNFGKTDADNVPNNTYIMPMMFDVWILHQKKESPEELYENFKESYRTLGAIL